MSVRLVRAKKPAVALEEQEEVEIRLQYIEIRRTKREDYEGSALGKYLKQRYKFSSPGGGNV